jgi:hypothetical protein
MNACGNQEQGTGRRMFGKEMAMDTAVERGSREIEERQTLGAGQQQPRALNKSKKLQSSV